MYTVYRFDDVSDNNSDIVVDACLDELGANASQIELLRCVTKSFTTSFDSDFWAFSRNVLLVYSTALVFYMQSGFAMLCAGNVRKKNVQNTMLKNLLDACGAALGFFVVGYAFAYGGQDADSTEKTFIGNANFFLMGVEDLAFWLFQYAFSAASATIVAGTLAERCQMAAYLAYSVLLGGFVYPVIAHAIWSTQGFLSANARDPLWGIGMVDFAGSGVVHMTGGTTALFATMILGPRRGRFHDDTGRKLAKPNDLPGHSIALQMLGTFTLWFGWYGFNAGSALILPTNNTESVLPLSGVNTTLAGGAGGITALFMNLYLLERYTGEPYFDLRFLMNGTLSGLVAITGSCGVVEPWAAVVIGSIAGLVYMIGSWGLVQLRLDDCVDAIPVHMLNGIWGCLAVGLFAAPSRLEAVLGNAEHVGFFYSFSYGGADATLLGIQCVGVLFILGWVMCIMLPFFIWLDTKGWFRSDPLDELIGLDTSYHGGVMLAADTDHINPEYISAYKKRKEDHARRRDASSNGFGDGSSDADEDDDDKENYADT